MDTGDSAEGAWLAMLVLGPVAALLLQLSVRRSHGYQADTSGAALAGYPR